ncbi:MAG: transcription elongation factor GreA [Patescibacteria group bacterium]
MAINILTPQGKKKLEQQLADLKLKRMVVANKIKDAKELGDLSENAEYHAAKEEQGQVEAKILEITSLLKNAKIIEPSSSKTKVVLGSKIKVQSDSDTFDFEIVGLNESDPSLGKISASSPLGSAFLGAKKGEIIEVNVPAGRVKYKIVGIR